MKRRAKDFAASRIHAQIFFFKLRRWTISSNSEVVNKSGINVGQRFSEDDDDG